MEPKSRIHFGSLEEKEKIRIETEEKRDGGVSEAVRAGMQAGNINITQGAHYLKSLALKKETFGVEGQLCPEKATGDKSFNARACLL